MKIEIGEWVAVLALFVLSMVALGLKALFSKATKVAPFKPDAKQQQEAVQDAKQKVEEAAVVDVVGAGSFSKWWNSHRER